MSVLLYLLVPAAIVALVASVMWLRDRQPKSLQSGINSFRREMDALSPSARPVGRAPRPETPSTRRPPRPRPDGQRD